MGTVGGQDAVDRFTAHPTVQKENAILRGEADTYDNIRLSPAQTAGLEVGQLLRKPCGTLAVIVHVMTTHDAGNEHDYPWCKVKTADGPYHAGGEKPTPEQVKDWEANTGADSEQQYEGDKDSDGAPHGQGKLTEEGDYEYEGEFCHGEFHGKGTFKDLRGDGYVQEGTFESGTFVEGSFTKGDQVERG